MSTTKRMVHCIKLNREAEGLASPPLFLGAALSKKIFDHISKEAWEDWQKYQTMLINENRLNLSDPRARQYLMQQLEGYLFNEQS